MTTAIIPARGGSKGVPGKNLRYVGGMSLVRRAITTCQKVCDRVIVSTEDERIADEAVEAGASVHIRPPELATDDAPTWPTIQHAGKGVDDVIAVVQCTAPLLTDGDIAGTIETLDTGCDVAIACHESHVFLLTEDGTPINTTFPIPRRQDFAPQYAISGSVWAFHSGHLRRDDLYSGTIGIHISERPERLDIDTPQDLLQAQKMFHTCDYQMWGEFNGGFWI